MVKLDLFSESQCVSGGHLGFLAIEKKYKLNCVGGEHKPARCRCFSTVTLRLTPVTLKREGDLDVLKIYFHSKTKLLAIKAFKTGGFIE